MEYHFKKCYRKHHKRFHISKYTVDLKTYSLNYHGTAVIPNPPRWNRLGCSYSCLRLPARWALASPATASNVSSCFIHVSMWLRNTLLSLIVHRWKIKLLLLQCFQTNNKNDIKAPIYCSFVRWIWYKGPAYGKRVAVVTSVWQPTLPNRMIPLTHWGGDKMVAISRGHFQMYFLEWKCINFD